MASIATEPNGRKRIIFKGADGKRRTLRLGKVPSKVATSILHRVEQIAGAQLVGEVPPDKALQWVAEQDEVMREKLAAVGLATRRESATLGEFLAAYFARRKDVKRATLLNWEQTRRNLLEFFGPGKQLREVTIAQARDFERYLKTTARAIRNAKAKADDPLSAATIRKRIRNAKQFFGDALDRGLIESNPFAKLKGASLSNASRQFFVTHEMTEKLLEACPDEQWRLIVSLVRYGGLRCPSELVGLELDDADWERGRLRVRSPKTEHHEGKAERIIPIFPELVKPLLDVSEAAEPGTKYFITRYRDAGQNLRTTFQKIINRAGLVAWPKLFQNLRSSRQTELEETYPSHVVCAWMGNSQAVAQKHYLQVTEDHFDQASQKAARNPARTLAEHGGIGGSEEGQKREKPRENRGLTLLQVGPEGLEPPTKGL